MAKSKHSHERHPGGRGRHNPQTPKGERPLHYGTTDRSERAQRAELRGVGGGGWVGGVGLGVIQGDTGQLTSTGGNALSPMQFGGTPGGPSMDMMGGDAGSGAGADAAGSGGSGPAASGSM